MLKKRQNYIIQCEEEKKHCADVQLPECSETQHEEQSVCEV